ncbi:MAG: sulfatase-like hydrolase/transferase [Eubacteriales bacterium]|nr:sulfatase-like hydrolase/transferase [Eubacteriales bacterium]
MKKTENKNEHRNQVKFIPAVVISAALTVLLFLYAPLIIYSGNYEDFTFDIFDVLKYGCLLTAVAMMVLIGAFTLIRRLSDKLYYLALAIALAGFVGFFVQGNFLIRDLPLMDGTAVNWTDYSSAKIISAAVWIIAGFAAVLIAAFAGKDNLEKTVSSVGCFGLFFLCVSLALTIFSDPQIVEPSTDTCMTADGFLELSENENFVIIMLDSVDASHFNSIVENDPHYKDVFSDFTFYKNTMAGYPFTQYSVPFFLFGQWYENNETYSDYLSRSLQESLLMKRLTEDEYDSRIFFDYLQQENISRDLFDNFQTVREFKSPDLFCKMLLKLVGFRYLPYGLKQYCELLPENIAYDSLKTNDGEEIDYYDIGVRALYDRINSTDITFSNRSCFRFICTEGAHAPFNLDKDINEIPDGGYDQSIEAAITLADAYISKMKDAGLYDNSIIIVLADHGIRGDNPNAGTGRQNPILLIKGKNEHHPYQVSDAPISHEDLPEAYMKLMDGEKGDACFSWNEGDSRTRRYMLSVVKENRIYEYSSNGHASDLGMMIESGTVY